MTEQEAYGILLQIAYDKEFPIGSTEALTMAIKALEKQIPIKPAYQGEHEKCPTCGSFCIDVYCAKCGQKIDYKE